jgi:uncharacterized protein YggE
MNAPRERLGWRQRMAAVVALLVLLAAGLAGPFAAAPPALARPPLQSTPETPGPTMVYVNGTGTVRITPDMATVEIGIEVERPALAEAQAEATTQASAIIAAIAANGVATEDIRTTSFNVRVVRDRERPRNREMREAARQDDEAASEDVASDEGDDPRDEGDLYQVSHAVEVTVRDLDTLGQLLDDAIAAGANDVRRVTFSLADPAPAADQARRQAMADALARAETLADAAGMTIVRPVTISETFAPAPIPVEFAIADASGGEMARAAAPVPIAVGEDEVIVEVSVAYELG